MEEGHCLREPRHRRLRAAARRLGDSRVEATSLYTLIQMVEGGHGRDAAAGDHAEGAAY